MSPSKSYIILPILILSLINSALAVSDENICDVQCPYCCRERQCRSEDECKGNFTPFVILGIVAGALVGLLILRKLYVYLKGKAPKKDPNRKRATRTRAKSPKPSKASKSKKAGKSNKEEKSQSRQEIYLQIDNESIVGVESNKPDEEREKKTSSKNDVTSKSRLEADDKGKETNRSDKKRETSVPKPKNGTSKASDKDKEKDKGKDKGKDKDKEKDKNRSSSASKKPAAGGSKPAASSKMTASSASAANKERGRSTNTSGKERSGSQKKGESSVGKDGKDKMKSSTASKK